MTDDIGYTLSELSEVYEKYKGEGRDHMKNCGLSKAQGQGNKCVSSTCRIFAIILGKVSVLENLIRDKNRGSVIIVNGGKQL